MNRIATNAGRGLGRWLPNELSPANSLAARLGWAHVLMTLVAAVVASLWFANESRARLEESTSDAFQQYATQISNEIDAQLYAKLQWLAASAAVFGDMSPGDEASRMNRLLGEFRRQLPEFEWIALAGTDGRLSAVTGGNAPAGSVADEVWFRQGRDALWADDLDWRSEERDYLQSTTGFLTISAPVRNPSGELVGVLGAQLSLDWARAFGNELADSLRVRRTIQVLVVNETGIVLFGPPGVLGTRIPGQPGEQILQAAESLRALRAGGQVRRDEAPAGNLLMQWPDGVSYLSGWALSDGYGRFPGLGWTVWVRENQEQAFAQARVQQIRVLLVVLLAGLSIIIAGLLVMRRLTRELADIARSADEIRAGQRADLAVTGGRDEAARIGHSLQALLGMLRGRTRALEELNKDLDARVAERTREVERLADENRHAALMRERLRLSRDMHDTLAQSLMSLLAQIRLIRKLARSDPARVHDELLRAEQAAQTGLREAREAIVQLRHHAVRDTGLGPALHQLACRTAERCGFQADYDIDPQAASCVDSRAEVVYRVAEEALRNVQRHSRASRLGVSLNVEAADGGSRLHLSVTDDGVGFDTGEQPRAGHYGIQGMREQAEMIGADFRIESAVGAGTRLSLRVPL